MFFIRSEQSKKPTTPAKTPAAPSPAAVRRAPAPGAADERTPGEEEQEGTEESGESGAPAGGTGAAASADGSAPADGRQAPAAGAQDVPASAALGDLTLNPSGPAFCGQRIQARASTTDIPADTGVGGELKSGQTSVGSFSGTTDGHVASATLTVENVHALLSQGGGLAAEAVAEAGLSVGHAQSDTKSLKLRRLADFGLESFDSRPDHRVANGYASIAPLYRGALSSTELRLRLRVKYNVGWRGWMLFIDGDWKPGWRMGAAGTLHVHDGRAWTPAPALPAASVREVAFSGSARECWGRRFPDPSLMPDYDVSSAEVRKTISEIERAWDDRFEVKRVGCSAHDCCRWRVRLETTLSPSESSPDATITLIGARGGPGRSNVYEWYFTEEVPTDGGRNTRIERVRDDVHAHEAGHMIGAYDEYEGGATGLGAARVIEDDSIMGANLSTPHKRHMQDAATFLAQKARSKHRVDWRLELKDKGEA